MVLKMTDAIQARCSKCTLLSTLGSFMLCFIVLLSGHTVVTSGNKLVWGVSVGDDIAGASLSGS